MAPALEQMLFYKEERRRRKVEGTPGNPNQPLGLGSASQDQIEWERFNSRRPDESDPLRQRDRQAAEDARQRSHAGPPVESVQQDRKKPLDRLAQALRATDQMLQSGGFRVVVLDLASVPAEQALRVPSSTWFRFRRAAQESDAIPPSVDLGAVRPFQCGVRVGVLHGRAAHGAGCPHLSDAEHRDSRQRSAPAMGRSLLNESQGGMHLRRGCMRWDCDNELCRHPCRRVSVVAWLRKEPACKAHALAVVEGAAPHERMIAFNAAARSAGVMRGMSKVQAEAAATFRFRARQHREEQDAFWTLIEVATRYSPLVQDVRSPANGYGSDGRMSAALLLDRSGTETLFGSAERYAWGLLRELDKAGFPAAVATAPNAEAALLLARCYNGVTCVDSAALEAKLAPLPVSSLPCTHTALATFTRWGIRT